MLNWGALIGEREEVVNNSLHTLSLQKNNGECVEIDIETCARDLVAANLSDENAHPVSPLAVCLLLACCRKIEADEQETVEAMLSLRRCTPAEQVRSWAILCIENGIDPNQVQQPASPAPGEGVECRGCQHLGMGWVHQPGVRRVFRFRCGKQHALLELGFFGERVLIAPPECGDYAGKSSSVLASGAYQGGGKDLGYCPSLEHHHE